MTDTPRRYSTWEVRACIWQTLRTHFLPLMLSLLILSAPMIIAGALEGMAQDHQAQADLVAAEALALYNAYPDGLPDGERSHYIGLFSQHADLEYRASTLDLVGSIFELSGHFLAMPLLLGVDLVLIRILRGNDYCWQDARITYAQFRRGFKLQCCLLVILLILQVPGMLIRFISNVICGGAGEIGLILEILALLVTLGLVFIAQLRFQMAPRLLADGAKGTSGELLAQSAEILDLRSLRPQLSILSPGFLLLFAAGSILYGLQMLLPGAAAGVIGVLLYLPGYAYLLVGSAAVYTTFREA